MEGDIILDTQKQPSSFVSFLKKSWFIILDIIIIVAFIIYFIIDSMKSSTLTVLVTPSDSTITINGKTYSNGTYRFFPGEITATITKDGFESKSQTLTLEKNSDTRLYAFLTQEGNNFNYYRTNSSDLDILYTVAKDSTEAQDFLAAYDDEKSLENFLPLIYNNDSRNPSTYINLTVTYNTEKCKERPFCILITDTFNGHLDVGLSLLKQYGYDPANYEIIYEYLCEQGDINKCPRI